MMPPEDYLEPEDDLEEENREESPLPPPDAADALAQAEKKAADYLASWQRTQADFINYKRRTEQEKREFGRYAGAEVILGLLPVVDDLELALAAVPADADNGWVEGVRLVERKFKTALAAQGVTQVPALGEPFDPGVHEALRQDRGEEGVVIEVLQNGYMMHERLLRPARVVVGDGSTGGQEEPEETAGANDEED